LRGIKGEYELTLSLLLSQTCGVAGKRRAVSPNSLGKNPIVGKMPKESEQNTAAWFEIVCPFQ
jgi:hypothetical protein